MFTSRFNAITSYLDMSSLIIFLTANYTFLSYLSVTMNTVPKAPFPIQVEGILNLSYSSETSVACLAEKSVNLIPVSFLQQKLPILEVSMRGLIKF